MTGSHAPWGWRRVWAIFEQAIGLAAEERGAFLDAAVAGDAELRAAVERMLAADRRASQLLDRPLASPPRAPAAAVPDAGEPAPASGPRTLPETVGAYRLLRQIGQGGMSTVYLAVRDDDAFRRQVVVKVVRSDLESEDLRRRLRAERQILAGLTHPNIARLYDGGSTVEGRPFFVMEHVEGERIDAYCTERRLGLGERLRLFRKVCDAVAFAHQSLVVHRDLKPSNILATPDGEPRLLDFGIAKLLDPELADPGEPTATWQRALTPSYASPEQIRGRATTTATDVYSLGVVLYRLLTGTLPFDFAGLSPGEIERRIAETEPVRPSLAARRAGAEAACAGRQLAGDLDAIVLKALRSTPKERYGSVEQLADDLDRYLDGLPVRAREGTLRYRAAKLVRRHRSAVFAAASAVLLLLGFAFAMSWQAAKTARERDQARLERDKKEHATKLVQDIFTLASPFVVPGSEMTVREAVERSVPLLDARLEDQPAVRADLLHTSGAILGAVGQHEVAARQLRAALEIRRGLLDEGHPELIETMDLLAGELAELGRLQEAEALARTSLAWTRASATPRGVGLPAALTRMATVLCYRAEFEGAERIARESLALARAMPVSKQQEVTAHEFLGLVESARGAYDRAVAHYRTAVAGRRALHGADHPAQIAALNNLGLALRRAGDLDAAAGAYQELLALQRFNFGADYVDPNTTVNLAGLQVALGAFDSAEALYVRALDELGGPTSDHPARLHVELRLAEARVLAGRAAVSEGMVRAILARERPRLGADHWRIAQAESILGASLSARGRHAEAEPLLVGGFERLLGAAKHRYAADALGHLQRHFEATGQGDRIAGFAARLEE